MADIPELNESHFFEDLELCKMFDSMFVKLSMLGLTMLAIEGPILVIVGLCMPALGLSMSSGLSEMVLSEIITLLLLFLSPSLIYVELPFSAMIGFETIS